ncbi:thioesterase family protein [Sodaliphilus pleomorphus]|uniref:Dihydrolipoamide acyltransferase n=1 Tax=Sodaliphilus pleomorphus TaxID=2606626 RepID=A0A6L5XH82_9BACT|nr:thioesterase family protein [Sodaliphilus pleomorphus]MSS18790.1 dihydrolipoamide acyltransferase [Sodaliphilus pleomorphus]
MIHQGLTHTSTLKVTNADTALEMGSGDMPVLATPAMTALMENAAMLAVSDSLPEGCTTVGGHISTSHLKPSRVGAQVSATATLDKIDGRKLYFTVKAHDGDTLIGEGSHLRFIVERERFMAKL